MAVALSCISLQLPHSRNPPSIPLARHLVSPGHLSQRRLRPLSLPATACISLHLPSIPHARHLVRPGQLSPRRLRPLSLSATAASAFSSASAARPLTSLRGQNIQPLDELLETDGAGWNGGRSGGGAAGDQDGDSNATACISLHLPSIPHAHARHLVRPGQLSPRRLRQLSLSTTAASAFSSASAAPPLTSFRGQNIQPLDELLETDGAGWNGGRSGGGAAGDQDGDSNRKKLLMVMVPPRSDWPPENPPADSDGSERFFELEKCPVLRWLLRFGGIKDRLLTDDVFLAKLTVELGMFAETAAVYEHNFFKELEIVFADVVIAMIADFMSVHLPVPTASLAPALANIAGPVAQFFHGCPDSAFQIALPGASYSLAQRLGALAINGAKLFAVGTASSMVRMAARSALIDARNVVEKSSGGEMENVPILSTSLAYGVYMAISSNLRSQVLDGVIDRRTLEPLLYQHKLMLSAIRFAVRIGNTFLGSMLWTDYARRIRIE